MTDDRVLFLNGRCVLDYQNFFPLVQGLWILNKKVSMFQGDEQLCCESGFRKISLRGSLHINAGGRQIPLSFWLPFCDQGAALFQGKLLMSETVDKVFVIHGFDTTDTTVVASPLLACLKLSRRIVATEDS